MTLSKKCNICDLPCFSLYITGFSEAIAQHLLKKFLLLVYFLDYAKCQHMIKHDPCLFCKDSEYKVGLVWIKNILKNVPFDSLLLGTTNVCLKTYMNNILVKHEYTAYCAKQEFNIIVTFEKIGCVSQDLKNFQSCSRN